MSETISSTKTVATADLSSRMTAAVVAGLLGTFFLFGVAFAQPDVLHNAAHDVRHSVAFPCH
jgi:cobalt transporter subunit CbtB